MALASSPSFMLGKVSMDSGHLDNSRMSILTSLSDLDADLSIMSQCLLVTHEVVFSSLSLALLKWYGEWATGPQRVAQITVTQSD